MTWVVEALDDRVIKHLQGALWEVRMKGRDGISRAICVTAKGRRVVVIRVFVKLALARAKEVK